MKHSVISTTAENYFDDMEKLIQLRGSPLTIPNEASQFKLCNEIKKNNLFFIVFSTGSLLIP